MKKFSALVITFGLCASVLAQVQSQNIDMDVDSEIDQLYQAPVKKVAKPVGSTVFTQTVMMPQQQSQVQSQQQVQKQPTTLIEASPLSDSKADTIRKNRQDEEMKTETRIVEKLEQSRMEDEKKRAAVLFGDKFDNLQNSSAAQSAVQVAPAPMPIQPVYIEQKKEAAPEVVIEPRETLSRDAVREEVRAALEDDSKAIITPVETRYFSGYAGIGEYPDVKNVKGNYSLGAAFGTRFDYFMVEGAFIMSNYGVDVNNYASVNGYRVDSYDVNQYQGSLAAKYQMLGGFVRPVLGGVIAYSYRKYALTNNYVNSSQDTGSSNAIDLGIIAGVDLEFNSKVSIGFDFKYMFNMSSRITSNYSNSSYGYIGTPLEKLQYYTSGIVARVNF
ncbi:MAG: hypothetical protein WA160_04155 [Pseudobdellovibrio sp.]